MESNGLEPPASVGKLSEGGSLSAVWGWFHHRMGGVISVRSMFRLVYTALAAVFGTRFMLDGLSKTLKYAWSSAPVGDAQVDWVAAKLFLEHKTPYTPEGLQAVGVGAYGFGHPPTTPFWFIPLATLDYGVMGEILALGTIACLMIGIWLCAVELRFPAPLATTLLVSGACLTTNWMTLHLHVLQISEFIAFAYIMAWYFLRRDRQIRGGIALGAACTLKLFPGLLVLWLVVTRRWKAVAAACATYGIVAVVMTRVYGLGCWRLFFHQQKAIAAYWIGHIRNSSLHGIIIRLFNPACVVLKGDPAASVAAMNEKGEIPVIAGNTLASLAAVTCILAGGWLVLKYLRRGGRESRSHQSSLDLVFAFATTLSAFVNPWVWEHYAVLLIMPMMVCIDSLRHRLAVVGEDLAKGGASVSKYLGTLVASCLVLVPLGTAVWALSQDCWLRESRYEALERVIWAGGEMPVQLHHLMHSAEVIGWLPWPCVLLASGVLLYWGILAARSSVTT